ncbi:MAG: porphobilinogen synthase [Bdellovibrionales bacterium]|nr:porphobilinogen synthase [Bdellovibrionales bacterium]
MKRPMRLRQNRLMRDLVAEARFTRGQLLQPLFAVEGIAADQPITGLGETARQPLDSLLKRIGADLEAGVTQFLLFPVPGTKGESGFRPDFAAKTIGEIKKRFGSDLLLWVDTCLCSLTSHGHCGVFHAKGAHAGQLDLEATRAELANLAKTYAAAGADGISPSDMMDGRVAAIRSALDGAGLGETPIMSYSTKFSSCFYGPFREAADSAPKFGDRKAYQIDARNRTDAIESSVRCAEEGADLLMVKPGMTSIDLILPIHEATGKPVGAYQVSGEYASLTLLAEKGLVSFDDALLETWAVFKRAGAQYLITYGARHAKRLGL